MTLVQARTRAALSISTALPTITGAYAVAGSTLLYAFVPGSLTLWALTAAIATVLAHPERLKDAWTGLRANKPLLVVLALSAANLAAILLTRPSTPALSAAAGLAAVTILVLVGRPSVQTTLAAFVLGVTAISLGGLLVWPFVQSDLVDHAGWPVPAWIAASEGAVRFGYWSMPFGLSTAMTNATFHPFLPFSDLQWVQVGGMSFEPSAMSVLALLAYIVAPLSILPRRSVIAVRMVLAAFIVVSGAVTGWLALPITIAACRWPSHTLRLGVGYAVIVAAGLITAWVYTPSGAPMGDIVYKVIIRSQTEIFGPWQAITSIAAIPLLLQTALGVTLSWQGWRWVRDGRGPQQGVAFLLVAALSLRLCLKTPSCLKTNGVASKV